MAVKEINLKDVLDYCWCAKYYELKNQNPNECNLKELYDNTLHKVFYSYLLALQRDTLKDGMGFLKFKWGKEWIKQKTNSQIICTPSAMKRDTYDAKRKAGIDAIITFNELMDTPQFPIIINKEYEVPIGKGIILRGRWEYIREIELPNGQRRIQIMKFKTENNRFQILSQMNHDLELTAAAYAFEHTFNATEFDLLYVDIYKKKIISSVRNPKDYQLLQNTVTSAVTCIQNKIRLISPDKRCYHCEYRDVCRASME